MGRKSKKIENLEDVRRALSEVYRGLMEGRIEPKKANAAGYILNIMRAIFEGKTIHQTHLKDDPLAFFQSRPRTERIKTLREIIDALTQLLQEEEQSSDD